MKTNLTTGQSARLVELGVCASKATETYSCRIKIAGGEYHSHYPIFTLTDILSLLPKEIKHKGDPYGLDVNWDDYWEVSYFNAVNFVTPNKEGSIAFEQAPELIDALFELLCWVLANRPDEIKK